MSDDSVELSRYQVFCWKSDGQPLLMQPHYVVATETQHKTVIIIIIIIIITTAGLTYLGRVCTMLVGPLQFFFHHKNWWPFIVVISIHSSHTTMRNFSMTVLTSAWWWRLQCGGASYAHCAHSIIWPWSSSINQPMVANRSEFFRTVWNSPYG